MSWHFSRALEAVFWEESCSGGKPSAPWSSIPSAADDSCSAKMKDTFHHSPFGTMYAPSTESRGAELLTWFQAGFPARTSAQPEKERDSTANEAAYGQKWQGSLARYDRATSLWKTAQCSLLADSDEYSETWPRWGSMRNGASYLRPIPALRTSESASGLWQTPVADDACNRKSGKWNSRGEPKLSAEVLMWPTLTAGNSHSGGSLQEWGGSRARKKMKQMVSQEELTGQLNPEWVEWLMGWPIGWTGCEPLETVKFQEWQQQHGKC